MRRRELLTLSLGVIAGLPTSVHAQTGKPPKVGILWHAGSAEEEGRYFHGMVQGFRDLGYIDGQNIVLEHRFPDELPDRFRSMAAELVALKVDVLVTVGTQTAPYGKEATSTIPVVFLFVPGRGWERLRRQLGTARAEHDRPLEFRR
jgi:putative tryptophan/tyrosine transport system substrate-binding protein